MHILLPQLAKTMRTKALGKLERGIHLPKSRESRTLSTQGAWTGVKGVTRSLGEALAFRVADQGRRCPLPSASHLPQPTLLYPRPI